MRTTGDMRVRWARLLSSSCVWERTLATRAYPYAPRVGAYMCPVGLTDGRCVPRDLHAYGVRLVRISRDLRVRWAHLSSSLRV